MRSKICGYCHKKFETREKVQSYCSRRCFQDNRKRVKELQQEDLNLVKKFLDKTMTNKSIKQRKF